jgi:hypothetical protein
VVIKIADAIADLGQPEEIGKVFASFQKYLYQHAAYGGPSDARRPENLPGAPPRRHAK